MTARSLKSEALKLRPAERMNLARELFESVDDDADEADVKISPEFAKELDRRLRYAEKHPESCISFDDAEKELDKLMRQDARARK